MTQITERIYIGSKADQPYSAFTCVLNLAPDLYVLTHEKLEYAAIGLIDGPGNRAGTIAAAVLVLHQLFDRHESVVLICHGGSGRSGLVAALYLAARHETKFEHALQIVTGKRPEATPNGDLRRDVATIIPLLQNLLKG